MLKVVKILLQNHYLNNLEKTMDEQSFVPKTVTSDDIAQMELDG